MSDEKNTDHFVAFVLGIIIGGVLGGLFMSEIARDTWRAEAVKVNAAEWVPTETGYVKWQWKTPKAEKDFTNK